MKADEIEKAIVALKNEDCYAISDRLDNSVEVYCCPMCGKELEEKP